MVWSRSENASFSDAILYQHDHFAKTGGDKYRENSKKRAAFSYSDNGAAVELTTGMKNSYPLRGGYYTNWDGGVRANAFVNGGARKKRAILFCTFFSFVYLRRGIRTCVRDGSLHMLRKAHPKVGAFLGRPAAGGCARDEARRRGELRFDCRLVRNAPFRFSHLCIKTIISPRQARDKHIGKALKKER